MKLAEFVTDIFIYGLIISLMVHHFFLQSFKVMTRSMEPTLIGDERCGDRILVKKYAYEVASPQRWQSVVFFYPHNNRQIFIKRLIGLPGEKVHIRNGEIYINEQIARKPPEVVDQLLYPIFQKQDNIEDHWQFDDKWQQQNRQLMVKSTNISWCKFKHVITNRYEPINNQRFFYRKQYAYPVGGGQRVGEIRFTVNVKRVSSHGNFIFELREGEYRFVCEIFDGTSGNLRMYHGENQQPLQTSSFKCSLESKVHKVVFANIDDIAYFEIDGQRVVSLDYAKKQKQAPRLTYDSSFRYGVQGGEFVFSDMKLWRDIYYIAKRDFFGGLTDFKVPQHQYFVLGDNPPNSRDSKDWQRFCFFYKNGRSVEGDQKNFPHGTSRKFVDIYGFDRNISNELLKEDYLSRQDSPFVPASYLIGHAVFVFWPITRAKLIY